MDVDTGARVSMPGFNSSVILDLLELGVTVKSCIECGLFSMAFHPRAGDQEDVAHAGLFYTMSTNIILPWSYSNDNAVEVYEWRMDVNSGIVDVLSKRLILHVPLRHTSHHGGSLRFSPLDGYLYVGLGDGAHSLTWNDARRNGQNHNTLLGAILRVNVNNGVDDFPADTQRNFGIPPSNPHWDTREVFSYGWRNPFRCSFDRYHNKSAAEAGLLGDAAAEIRLVCGDVGNLDWEEINILNRGGTNYGWSVFEGPLCMVEPRNDVGVDTCEALEPEAIAPAFFYRNNIGCVIGGIIYRGSSDPRLFGEYLFQDMTSPILYDEAAEVYTNMGSYVGERLSKHIRGIHGIFDEPDRPIGRHASRAYQVIMCNSTELCNMPPGYDGPFPPQAWSGKFVSFGEDERGEMWLFATSGVYRLVSPEKCGISVSDDGTFDSSLVEHDAVVPTNDDGSRRVGTIFTTLDPPNLTIPKVVDTASNETQVLVISKGSWDARSFVLSDARMVNGGVPGPTLLLARNHTARILVKNELPDMPANAVNLHFHGLHVSPRGNGDNVSVAIQPGAEFLYEVAVPADHPTGTFWYHAHVHHYSGLHIMSGLVGALIVTPGASEADTSAATFDEDVPLVLQHFAHVGEAEYGNFVEVAREHGLVHSPVFRHRIRDHVLVNGVFAPTLVAASRALLRLRMINAGGTRFLRLQFGPLLDVCTAKVVAYDGVADEPREVGTLGVLVPPGGRVDVALSCDASRVVDDDTPRDPRVDTLEGHWCGLVDGSKMEQRDWSLLGGTVVYTGDILRVCVPLEPQDHGAEGVAEAIGELHRTDIDPPSYLDWTSEIAAVEAGLVPGSPTRATQQVEVSFDFGGGINGIKGSGNEKDVFASFPLGTPVHLTVSSDDSFNHPYHQHTHHFQILSFGGSSDAESYERTGMYIGQWRDTIPVGPTGVVVAFTPRHFSGPLVVHCHISHHADHGMIGHMYVEGPEDGLNASTPVEDVDRVADEFGTPESEPVRDGPSTTSADDWSHSTAVVSVVVALLGGIALGMACVVFARRRSSSKNVGGETGQAVADEATAPPQASSGHVRLESNSSRRRAERLSGYARVHAKRAL
eukprot:CAMPEP_0170753250 /NCGR_PEP_ID=MMETSP0437-20130122/12393_1 /TAXON_ID=0 /ORGANISM="Sexangularia sp." /LENGTH=1096 /DNA_ID=CAMNT_0011092357 /DNA_START=229 /DNA_END=3519 /DNA_ORIENTATION=-